MNQNFSEILSSQLPTPDTINKFMDSITYESPNTATSCNYNYRTDDQMWSVKALQLRPSNRQRKRTVILASGLNVRERGTISVSLHIAAMLARRPFDDADMTILPLVNPKEYLEHQGKKKVLIEGMPLFPFLSEEENPKDVSSTFLGLLCRFYKLNYVSARLDLHQEATTLVYKGNKRAHELPSSIPLLQSPTLIANDVPAIVIELRDKCGVFGEDHIIRKGAEVMTFVKALLKETEPR